jgi:hypothetical protein
MPSPVPRRLGCATGGGARALSGLRAPTRRGASCDPAISTRGMRDGRRGLRFGRSRRGAVTAIKIQIAPTRLSMCDGRWGSGHAEGAGRGLAARVPALRTHLWLARLNEHSGRCECLYAGCPVKTGYIPEPSMVDVFESAVRLRIPYSQTFGGKQCGVSWLQCSSQEALLSRKTALPASTPLAANATRMLTALRGSMNPAANATRIN